MSLFGAETAPKATADKTGDKQHPAHKAAKIYFDGLCEPVNPGGHCCYGYIIQREDGPPISGTGTVGRGTNNKAEYTALIEALKSAAKAGISRVEVHGDSLLVVNQVRGLWEVRSDSIRPLWELAAKLARGFEKFNITWIPREQNTEADRLSRIAYHEATGSPSRGTRRRPKQPSGSQKPAPTEQPDNT
jgi:ribonuclease HI